MNPHPAPVSAGPALEPSVQPADAIEVGRVLGAWGVKGGLKVKPFSADAQALFAAKRWFLQASEVPRPPGAQAATPLPAFLDVQQAREQSGAVVATVKGLTDRDVAQAMSGARVFVSRVFFPATGDQEFYWIDLIGLSVHNRAGLVLGDVVGLIETGPHCVLRIRPPGADEGDLSEERLIPFVDAYVDAVDLTGRRITVDWEADY
jgi:16S rRNA processing protein RimM